MPAAVCKYSCTLLFCKTLSESTVKDIINQCTGTEPIVIQLTVLVRKANHSGWLL